MGDRLLPHLGNGGYDAQHYDITIDYDPVTNTMLSSAGITLRATQALSEFSLDLRGLNVSSVTIDGVAATFTRDEDNAVYRHKLIVTPAAGIANNRVFHVVVDYNGVAEQLLDPDESFEGWTRTTSGPLESRGAFVVNEPMGAMTWFPNNNHPRDKATYDFHLTAPNAFSTAGNGELVSKVTNGDKTTWNWSLDYPMASYLSTATMGVYDYSEYTGATAKGRSGQPLKFYDYIESSHPNKANLATAAARQDAIIKWMSDTLQRPYPFESHGVVVHRSPAEYALEVQTKSHFGTGSISLSTLAHEIAHQWFGDSIGPDNWDVLWFNEGFATWWAWYWANKQNNSATTVEQQFNNAYNPTTNASRWNNAPTAIPNAAAMFFPSFPNYTRSGAMLEGYRQIVGDSAFFAMQRMLIDEYSDRVITTPQFVDVAKRAARDHGGFIGSNLDKLEEYFDQWLNGTVRPALNPTTFFQSTSNTGTVTGSVPATLSLTLGAPASFGAFIPGSARDYTASTQANVVSTAGDAALSVADPSANNTGKLVNGAFALAQPLQVNAKDGTFAPVGGAASPTAVLTYTGPVSNDSVALGFKQSIGANEPLRTGTYSKTLTFTLSTTNP
jgi:aminopeptidase N